VMCLIEGDSNAAYLPQNSSPPDSSGAQCNLGITTSGSEVGDQNRSTNVTLGTVKLGRLGEIRGRLSSRFSSRFCIIFDVSLDVVERAMIDDN
jgi:hypothetical protein